MVEGPSVGENRASYQSGEGPVQIVELIILYDL
jgi:hypothetical protein